MLPHHNQQASDDQNQTEHGRMLPSNMLLLNLIQLIDVTFSTPTPVINNRLAWWILRQVWRKFSKVKITMSVPVVLLLLGGISAAQTSIPTGSAPRIVLEVSAVSFDITWQ